MEENSLKAVQSSGWLLIVTGAISMVAGILALVYPDITLLALALIAGINVFLFGLLAIVNAISADEDDAVPRALLAILGILGVLAGLIMMRRPGETLLVRAAGGRPLADHERLISGIIALTEPEDRGARLLAALFDVVLGGLLLALPKLSLATVAIIVRSVLPDPGRVRPLRGAQAAQERSGGRRTGCMTRPGLADDELAELRDLIRGADGVELKLTVPESDQRSAVAALGMDPIDAQIRQVFFFDTPDLALNQAGLVVRARRVQNKGDDSVVKLRPVVPAELPDKLRRSSSFGVEVDAMPGGYVCSGSLKHALAAGDVKDVMSGSTAAAQAVLQAPASLLRRPRARAGRTRRPRRPRPDLRAQAQVLARGLRAQARRRDVALPGRLADPRALDQVPAGRRVPDRGGDARLPRPARHRPLGRATDEDAARARVLQREAGAVAELRFVARSPLRRTR